MNVLNELHLQNAATLEAVVSFWCEHGSRFMPEFVREFDSILTTQTCS